MYHISRIYDQANQFAIRIKHGVHYANDVEINTHIVFLSLHSVQYTTYEITLSSKLTIKSTCANQ